MQNHRPTLFLTWLFVSLGILVSNRPIQSAEPASVFSKDNLVAWCIVPFDAKKRTPVERAEMLRRLGLTKVAYDWRNEHVESFEDEIIAYQKNDLEFFAFWDVHESMFELFKKYKIAPQVWKMLPQPKGKSQTERVESVAKRFLPLVKRTKELGCKLGIYNHGGWTGEPENMVAVIQWLRANTEAEHVGIVYNFHHGHEHIERFANLFSKMQPYLLCVNINGMNDQAKPKILELGQGKHERSMLKMVKDSGYEGPIGILDHRSELDAEAVLKGNLQGLMKILIEADDTSALSTFVELKPLR